MLREAGNVMRKKVLLVYLLLISAAVLLSQCKRPATEPEAAVQVGQAAPQFKLPDLKGREFALDQYRGKIVLLDFWATWCGPCRMTMPLLEKLQHEFPNDLALLAINLQEPDDVVREYIREQNISSQVLLDKEGSVGLAYGAESIPMQILIDKNGITRDIQLGFSPGMASQLRDEIQKLR
jgi:thiol-disulfide isomerase/thioredoxin